MRLVQIAAWQGGVLTIGAATLLALERGSVVSLAAGGGFMLLSLILQRFAVKAAFRRSAEPGLAMLFVLGKLGLVLGLLYVGLRTAVLGPVSFAAGATTLPVAILLDVCYSTWSSRRARAGSP